MLTETVNPWLLPEVADAQLALVEKQLALDTHDPVTGRRRDFFPLHPPFREFAMALEHLIEGLAWRKISSGTIESSLGNVPISLLDVGCGVGHYGVLCRDDPGVRYFGTDVSPYMIARAKELLERNGARAALTVCPWDKSPFNSFDIVLLSQVLETTDNPPAALEFVLAHAKKFVMLHRVRVTGKAGRVYEPTYCNYSSQNWIWDRESLNLLIARYGKVWGVTQEWDGMLTMIVDKQ